MAYGTPGQTRGTARGETGRLPRPRPGVAPVGRARSQATTLEAIGFPIFVGAVHFLIVQFAASLAYRYGTMNSSSPPYKSVYGEPVPLKGLARTLVEPLRQWDGLWYKLIADRGYAPANEAERASRFGEAKAAFWPLFPWLMHLGHRLTGISTDVAGYVIANVAFVVALIVLYRLVALDFDRAVARRTLWALALFPTALFFSAVYTESLFLLLAVAALLAARLRHWWIAGLLGALGALTRSYGVLLVIPFAVLFLQQHRFQIRRWFPNAIAAALPVLGPLIFGFYLGLPVHNGTLRGLPVLGSLFKRQVWDDPLDFVHVQEQWYRFGANPLTTFRCAIRGCSAIVKDYSPTKTFPVHGAQWGWVHTLVHHPSWGTLTSHDFRYAVAQSDTFELVSTILFLALAVVGLRYLPFYQSAYLIPGLVIPLFQPSAVHPLMSMPRFGLTLFPIFVMLALLFNRARVALPALAISTVLLVLFTVQFAQWYWVS